MVWNLGIPVYQKLAKTALYLIHTYATVFQICVDVVLVVKSRITQNSVCLFLSYFLRSGVRVSGSEIILQLKEILMGNYGYGTRENDAMLPGEVMKLTLPGSWTNSSNSWSFALEPTVLTVE